MNNGITERCYDGMNNRNNSRFNLEKHFHTVGRGFPLFYKDSSDFPAVQLLSLLKAAIEQLQKSIEIGDPPGVSWESPFQVLEHRIRLKKKTLSGEEKVSDLKKTANILRSLSKKELLRRIQDHFAKTSTVAFMRVLTRGVIAIKNQPGEDDHLHLPSEVTVELDSLPESEQKEALDKLSIGFEFLEPFSGSVDSPEGSHDYEFNLLFAIRPLTLIWKNRLFFPVHIGMDFAEGDPSSWSDEAQTHFWNDLLDALEKQIAELLAKRSAIAEPQTDFSGSLSADSLVPSRDEYFHAPGRLFDTPREAEKQKQLPAIGRWYMQTAFNRTVCMAAAALTDRESRDTIFDWQSATVKEIEDLVYWREDGTPAHGQHRQDILKAFEALRSMPVPIVQVNWKLYGTTRNPRWEKELKLRIGSLLQSYGAVFVERATGKEVHVADPLYEKHKVKGKPDRRVTMREMASQNIADSILESFPADRFMLTGFEWRWNTDIAEDFICPRTALDEKGNPRRKLLQGTHHEGRRYINLHRHYFEVQKNLRKGNSLYASRLLDLIVSEKSHLKKDRGKGAVSIEIEAPKVIKWLGLWDDYQARPTRVLEERIAPAIMALIEEKVMLASSWLVPQKDPNDSRRKAPFYRWKIKELWSTVALTTPEEAKAIKKAIVERAEAEAEEASHAKRAEAENLLPVFPGLEAEVAPPAPSGGDIKTARERAGLTLRAFAESFPGGPSHNTWARYERGEPIRVKDIKPETWDLIRAFVNQHGEKNDQ